MSDAAKPVRFRVYLAVSLDGFVADADGGVGWLQAFEDVDYGYEAFLAQIGTVVMGGRGYRQTFGFGAWPYAGKRVVVLSRRGLEAPWPAGVESFAGDVAELAARLAEESEGDVWVMGGAETVTAFLEADAVDELELYVMPVLLGDGVRLFQPREIAPLRLAPALAEIFDNGVLRLIYLLPRPGEMEDEEGA
ncbi:MAG TPA: dihydrofolate reductase family protein [Alphaproteobacteria bacterium]|nr:dihydrofolate reductase family protein [Alphaproteobacteria bacterium]